MIAWSIAVFVVVFLLYAGSRVVRGKRSSLRLLITRGVLTAACASIVTIVMLNDQALIAFALAMLFALVAWLAIQGGDADKKGTMSGFYRALGRADEGASEQRFGGGPVARWAGGLREAEYQALAATVGDAAEHGDATADAALLEIYEKRGESGAGRRRDHELGS